MIVETRTQTFVVVLQHGPLPLGTKLTGPSTTNWISISHSTTFGWLFQVLRISWSQLLICFVKWPLYVNLNQMNNPLFPNTNEKHRKIWPLQAQQAGKLIEIKPCIRFGYTKWTQPFLVAPQHGPLPLDTKLEDPSTANWISISHSATFGWLFKALRISWPQLLIYLERGPYILT